MTQLIAVAEAMRLLREHDLFRRDLTESHVLSWPMVRTSNGNPDYAFFVYPDPPVNPPVDRLSRPSHWLVVSGEQGRVKVFAGCDVLDFARSGMPQTVERPRLSPAMTLAQFRQAQQDHWAQFDRLAPFALAEKNSLPEEVCLDAQGYLAWLGLTHPGFMPYYEQLAPEFFEWLAQSTSR